jgi:hypothetical protein
MAIDPKEFVLGFDSLWNTGQTGATLSTVDQESVVRFRPLACGHGAGSASRLMRPALRS